VPDRMDYRILKDLKREFGDRVRLNEPMSRHTSFRTGGPADAWVQAGSVDELTAMMARLMQDGIPCEILGGGTNVLVRDRGIPGVVICLSGRLKTVQAQESDSGDLIVAAQGGARLAAIWQLAIHGGWEGFGFAVGIPGTVGGALRMNAGTPMGQIGDTLKTLTVMTPDGQIQTHGRDRLRVAYRGISIDDGSDPGQKPPVLRSGTFRLRRGDRSREDLLAEARAIMASRRRSQPIGQWSAGCFVKTPPEGPPAGFLIDRAGMKGMREGGAEVSVIHANFIVNRGNASAAQILSLADRVREKVYSQFKIHLENEVRVLGV